MAETSFQRHRLSKSRRLKRIHNSNRVKIAASLSHKGRETRYREIVCTLKFSFVIPAKGGIQLSVDARHGSLLSPE